MKAEFKSGIYVVVSKDGIEDIGWRVGAGASVTDGPVEFAPKDEIDMSFIKGGPPADAPEPNEGA